MASSAGPVRIAVLGHLNHDRIRRPGTGEYAGWGGVAYNVAALAGLFSDEARIALFSEIDPSRRREFEAALGPWNRAGGLDLSGVRDGAGPNEAILEYTGNERLESVAVRSGRMTDAQITAAADADMVLVNTVGGEEFDSASFDRLKRQRRGVMLWDVHCQTRPLGHASRRARCPLSGGLGWAAGCDVVQGSWDEIADLVGSDVPAPLVAGYLSPDWRKAFTAVLGAGVKVAVATFGRDGAWAAYAMSAGRPRFIWQPSVRVDERDPTGCGDTFSAGFLFGLVRACGGKTSRARSSLARSRPVREAMAWGAAAAAAKAASGGLLGPNRGPIEALLSPSGDHFDRGTETGYTRA